MVGLTILVTVVVLLVLLVMTAVVCMSDASVRLLSRSRTKRLVDADVPGAEALDALVEHPSRVAAAASIVRAVVFCLGTAVVAWAIMTAAGGDGWVSSPAATLLISAVAAAVVLFGLGEALPRTLAVQNPERVGLRVGKWGYALTRALAPVARGLAAPWVGIVSLVSDEAVHDAWLTGDEVAPEGPAHGETQREEAEEAFLEAVVDFSNTIVREVMVPRTDMVCLEDTATIEEAVETIRRTGLSRVPVYHETLDDILGVLYAKDLLTCIGRPDCPKTVAPLVREAFFVPETKPVDELLVEMRQRKIHMALVADEYGGTAGLVTIEDLLEEIVGEIFDEYDRAVELVRRLDDGTLLLDARLPVDDFNDLLGTAIDIEADSIGGLFVEKVGRIPQPGDSIEVEGVRLTVRDMEGNRVRTLVVEQSRQRDAEDEHAGTDNGK